jgi:hypothetical protein
MVQYNQGQWLNRAFEGSGNQHEWVIANTAALATANTLLEVVNDIENIKEGDEIEPE